MKNSEKKVKANSSGQLLIVAALAIAILISSTTIYVYELSREKTVEQNQLVTEVVFAIKQASRNAVISALANASRSGEKSVLETNLVVLSRVCRSLTQLGIYNLSFTLLSDSDYADGIWLSWNDNSGFGVSSAYVDFMLTVYGLRVNITTTYVVNIVTTITLDGYYTTINDSEKLVSLKCQVFNDGKPALAKNITLYYESLGVWLPVNSSNNFSITDYGNGTYAISFTVIADSNVQVSAHVIDSREIFVQANTTCPEA